MFDSAAFWKCDAKQVAWTSILKARGSEWSHHDEEVSAAKKGATDARSVGCQTPENNMRSAMTR
jgi:hypothetical protein